MVRPFRRIRRAAEEKASHHQRKPLIIREASRHTTRYDERLPGYSQTWFTDLCPAISTLVYTYLLRHPLELVVDDFDELEFPLFIFELQNAAVRELP